MTGTRWGYQRLRADVVDRLDREVLREQVRNQPRTLLNPAVPTVEKLHVLWRSLADISHAGQITAVELQDALMALAGQCLGWAQSIDPDEPGTAEIEAEKRWADPS